MAKLSDIKVYFEIEPIIKLTCLQTDCIHHLFKQGFRDCNLKYIRINPVKDGAQCEQFESIAVREAKKRGLANAK